jgi:hypothetical protein
MATDDVTNVRQRLDKQPQSAKEDRRSQSRGDGIFSLIEDATYEILRKHEKKSA